MLALNAFQAKNVATTSGEVELGDLNHVIIYALEWKQKSFTMTMILLLLLLVSTFMESLLCAGYGDKPLDAFPYFTLTNDHRWEVYLIMPHTGGAPKTCVAIEGSPI